MNKQHFAGFLAALAVTAVQFYALEADSATAPKDRGNPAVAEEVTSDSRLAGPAASSPVRQRRGLRPDPACKTTQRQEGPGRGGAFGIVRNRMFVSEASRDGFKAVPKAPPRPDPKRKLRIHSHVALECAGAASALAIADKERTPLVKIIIIGAGQVGRTAAYHLAREEANEVTVIDQNDELLRDLQDRLDIRTVCGNGAHPTVLDAAGAANADILIALTNSDEVNMLACEVAYALYGTATKIARVRTTEYAAREKLFSERGIAVDVWISPEQLVTEYIERLIEFPGALQVLDFADGRVRLVGVRALKGGFLVGQKLRALRDHIPKTDARVAAIYRHGRSIDPQGDTVIGEGDEVFFLAARKDIRLVMSEMRKLADPVKRVVIAGGGNIGVAGLRARSSATRR